MNQRLLLGVIIVLSLCCLTLPVMGAFVRDRTGGLYNPTLPTFDGLRKRFTARLKPSDLHMVSGFQTCNASLTRLSINVGGSCSFTIKADSAKTRQLTLQAGSGISAIQILLTQPNAISVDKIIKAGEKIDLDIFRNQSGQGAELLIKDCTVSSANGDGDTSQVNNCILEIKN